MIPRNELNTESKIRACRGASSSPLGAGSHPEEIFRSTSQKNSNRGYNIISAVCRCCFQSCRIYFSAHIPVKHGHPHFNYSRTKQQDKYKKRKFRSFRVQYFLNGRTQQIYSHNKNKYRYHNTRKIFVSGMTVWMVFIRRLLRKTKSHQSHCRCRNI